MLPKRNLVHSRPRLRHVLQIITFNYLGFLYIQIWPSFPQCPYCVTARACSIRSDNFMLS